MSQAKRRYSVAQVLDLARDPERALRCLGELVEDLFRSVNSVSMGPVVNGQRAGQMDGVWLVAAFTTAATATTFAHNLGRAPLAFIEAQTLPDPRETQVAGEVKLVSSTATTVVLTCAGANKKARLLLF